MGGVHTYFLTVLDATRADLSEFPFWLMDGHLLYCVLIQPFLCVCVERERSLVFLHLLRRNLLIQGAGASIDAPKAHQDYSFNTGGLEYAQFISYITHTHTHQICVYSSPDGHMSFHSGSTSDTTTMTTHAVLCKLFSILLVMYILCRGVSVLYGNV